MAQETHRIAMVRIFDAPRDLVFRTWTTAKEVGTWFAPPGFEVTHCELDARPGGRWLVEYRSAEGATYREYGEFREVVPPERLVLTLTQADGAGNTGAETVVTVVFADHAGKTEMSFEQTGFESVAVRDGNAEGWRGCFDKLDAHLVDVSTGEDVVAGSGAEQEIRREFAEWFRDSAAKDLDAVMTKIAPDVVSYEHAAPLVYRGADAVRDVCRQGFELAEGDFRWDIPDLEVVVRDDVAVTWGLNRMRVQEPGRGPVETWSRGTRVFQKTDGRWQMIHQHVSFPFDPATGQITTGPEAPVSAPS